MDYEKGKYQWVATITNHVVYYNSTNMEARYLCADALKLRNPDFASKWNIQAMDNRMVVPCFLVI